MNTGNLDKFWQRVAKAIPMLGCVSDDEALAAVRGLDRLLNAGGQSFLDLAAKVAPMSPPPPIETKATPHFGDFARAVRDLDDGELTLRERGFVLDMCRQGWDFSPSPRQAEWLGKLFERVSARKAAA